MRAASLPLLLLLLPGSDRLAFAAAAAAPPAASPPAAAAGAAGAAAEVTTLGEAPAAAPEAGTGALAPAGEGLSLQAAVNQSLLSSPRVRASTAERDAQVERRRGAWSDVGPRVQLQYNDSRFGSPESVQFPVFGNILLRPADMQTGSLVVTQPITGAFALADRARYEGTQLEAKDAGLKLTRGDVAFGTAETWLRTYQAQRQVEIAEASVAAAESQRRDGAALERAGRMNHGDVLKLDLAVSEARAGLAQAHAGRDVAFAALKEAIGLPSGGALVLSSALPVVPETVPELGPALKEAQEKRLETKEAEAGVQSAEFSKQLAYSNFSPSVNLFYQWDHTYGELAALGGLRDSKYYGVRASWDIWNDGSHVFAVREAAQSIHQAEELRADVDQGIRLDVQQALANLKAAQEALALARVAVSQAEEAYRIEQARFRTGTRSATDLILAEASETSARGQLVSAQTDLVSWHLKLQKALGAELPQL